MSRGSYRLGRGRWLLPLLFLGLASLAADVCYEGFRSIIGPLVSLEGGTLLEASAAVAIGELINWGLRLPAGLLADALAAWWGLTLLGYALTPVGVGIALYAGLPGLYIGVALERLGKTLRGPARDALLAGLEAPRGIVYGIHEALDQVGAVGGPLLAYYGLVTGSTWLLVAAGVLSVAWVAAARVFYEAAPRPRRGYRRARLYAKLLLVGSTTVAIPHPVVAASIAGGLGPSTPIAYAVIMASDAVAAIPLGRLYDALGAPSLLVGPVAGVAGAALLLASPLKTLGLVLVGVGVASVETIYRAYAASRAGREAGAFGALQLGIGVGQAASALLYALAARYASLL